LGISFPFFLPKRTKFRVTYTGTILQPYSTVKNLGKILLALTVFLLFTAAVAFLIRYLVYKNDQDPNKTLLLPHFSAVELELLDLRKDTAELNARVLMNNPLPVAFTADSLGYEFYIQGKKVMESMYGEKLTLQKGDSGWVKFPVRVFNKKLVNVLNGLEAEGLDSVTYEVNSTVYWHDKPFHLKIARFLPLFKIPDAKVTGVKVDTLRFSHAAIHVHVNFSNNNVFPIELKDIRYRFSFGGGPWVMGTKPGITEVDSMSFNKIEFPVVITFKGMGKTFFQLLKKGKNISYKMVIDFKLKTDVSTLRDCRVKMESEGKVDKVLEAVK
jgi:LEA14-like dessication related protein